MKDEHEARAYRRLVLQRARAELKLARLRKRARSEDTHRKFRLGGIGALVGWDDLSLEEMERRAEAVSRLIADESAYPDLRIRGRLFYAEREREAATSASPSFVSAADVRAQRRRQIVLGALLLRCGADEIDPAVITGAVLRVDKNQKSGTAS